MISFVASNLKRNTGQINERLIVCLTILSVFTAAILEERNNKMIFLWEINIIFMQISFIVWLLQHGRREHTL